MEIYVCFFSAVAAGVVGLNIIGVDAAALDALALCAASSHSLVCCFLLRL